MTNGLTVSSGGHAIGTILRAGGVENISSGGIDSGARISGGNQEVLGGTAIGATIFSGSQFVKASPSAP